jgi:tRNA dimethylallyltransferase
VPHHLIDIIDPLQTYSAADFARDATRLIGEIRARGKTPLIVGGTLLYFKALTEGLNDIPATNPLVRAQIQQRAAEQGWPALHLQLQAVDPATAARLAPNDGQRIGRALEVWTLTGQPLSAFHNRASTTAADLHIPVFSLEPANRAWLHDRIALRFAQMMAQGFLKEVRALMDRGDLHADLPSMRCVGYRQAWQGLQEGWSEAAICERGIFATRQLAKRQLTWLRSMPQRTVVAADAPDAVMQVLRLATPS